MTVVGARLEPVRSRTVTPCTSVLASCASCGTRPPSTTTTTCGPLGCAPLPNRARPESVSPNSASRASRSSPTQARLADGVDVDRAQRVRQPLEPLPLRQPRPGRRTRRPRRRRGSGRQQLADHRPGQPARRGAGPPRTRCGRTRAATAPPGRSGTEPWVRTNRRSAAAEIGSRSSIGLVSGVTRLDGEPLRAAPDAHGQEVLVDPAAAPTAGCRARRTTACRGRGGATARTRAAARRRCAPGAAPARGSAGSRGGRRRGGGASRRTPRPMLPAAMPTIDRRHHAAGDVGDRRAAAAGDEQRRWRRRPASIGRIGQRLPGAAAADRLGQLRRGLEHDLAARLGRRPATARGRRNSSVPIAVLR